jgi:hypothetical protein
MKNNTESNIMEEQTKTTTYVVIRDGYRVEDREYESVDDPVAVATKEFWTKVANNHSWGEKVEIVKYDSNQHRIW